MTREALEHDRIQVRPLEHARRERLRARIRLMGAVPLLPGLEHAPERANRIGVGGSRRRLSRCAREMASRAAAASGVECETRKGEGLSALAPAAVAPRSPNR